MDLCIQNEQRYFQKGSANWGEWGKFYLVFSVMITTQTRGLNISVLNTKFLPEPESRINMENSFPCQAVMNLSSLMEMHAGMK